jgi:hypothetical protein
VWDLQHLIDKLDAVHQFERRRMDNVAAKISLEIGSGLEQYHLNPLASEEQREHGTARTGADDATRRATNYSLA